MSILTLTIRTPCTYVCTPVTIGTWTTTIVRRIDSMEIIFVATNSPYKCFYTPILLETQDYYSWSMVLAILERLWASFFKHVTQCSHVIW